MPALWCRCSLGLLLVLLPVHRALADGGSPRDGGRRRPSVVIVRVDSYY